MQRIIVILSILAIVFTTASALLSLFAIRKAERDRNRSRTQAARDNRWNGQAVEEKKKDIKTETDEKI